MADDMKKSGGDFLLRQPFAFLGAVALLSLAQDLLTWKEWIDAWLEAFQAVTRLIWDILLGWFFEWVGFKFPQWTKDYLTVGIIISGMAFRAAIFESRERGRAFDRKYAVSLIIMVTVWPFTLLWVLQRSPWIHRLLLTLGMVERLRRVNWGRADIVFLETGIWVLIIIAINYALLHGGV